MDYSGFDQLLDEIELALHKLVSTYYLRQVLIERWRWDMPEITLMWYGEDAIWRSIMTFLTTAREGHIEVNAWRDVPREGGWIRRWRHEEVRRGSVETDSWCEAAYQKVAHWDELMLIHDHPLSQDAVAWIETQKTQHRTP